MLAASVYVNPRVPFSLVLYKYGAPYENNYVCPVFSYVWQP